MECFSSISSVILRMTSSSEVYLKDWDFPLYLDDIQNEIFF